ncbi:DUF4091 domain-containing protein [Paenibacillus sp. MWE-103]|uniref:DUF4091 domain-containing protein n=1 Tax=Paenibacillus artemisiicola TaxID=1172618 RepID=A0ABS3WEB8_9BACL|nr:DUF4091 domain-containing protein [Paenibacillus artemisiicola]MBO7746670.1 DUF4091 domain-containing protein [Paenibacillus artemisiicola]
MNYEVVHAHEWLYPDSEAREDGAKAIELAAARGGHAGCQLLLNGAVPGAPLRAAFRGGPRAEGGRGEPEAELYRLRDILVERNTGPVGFCLQPGESAAGYATREAPFRLFEALRPLTADAVAEAPTEALYVCWAVPADAEPGAYVGELTVEAGSGAVRIPVRIDVCAAAVPAKETLAVTNWFSLANMASRYGLEVWSEPHWAMIRKYGLLMRRARQTHFWVPLEAVTVELAGEHRYRFDFARAERLIRLYLGLGFTGIEGGLLAGRKDFRGAEFHVWNTWNGGEALRAVAAEGYAFLAQYLTAWRAFLEERGWLPLLVQHVADEPTENSKHEYRMLSAIVRKHLPGVPLLEAVETHDLGGAVDIWIPKNVYYEEHRAAFEEIRSLGDRLWFYTCCYPGGAYLNRLWDMPLLRTRYLHWANYLYGLDGFLHWGLNHCDADKDPYEQTGLLFPPGDTHLVYPGADGPLGSMRLEAMRAGIEDYELLRLLAAKDKAAADAIVADCLTSFHEMNEDADHFAAAHRRLLAAASEACMTEGGDAP